MKVKATVRRPAPGKPWMLDTMVDGKRYRKSIGHGSKRWAEKQADEKLEDLLLEDVKIIPASTVKGLLKAWDAYAKSGQSRKGVLKESSRKQARYAFLELVQHGAGLDAKADLKDVTPKAVRVWHSWKLEKGLEQGKEESRLLASIYARWTHAKSVFGIRALNFYRDYGLDGLDDWAAELRRVQIPRGHVPPYELPPQDLIDRTEKAGNKLRKGSPWLWVIYKLMINCGLRAGEVADLKREWVVEYRGGALVIELIRRPDWKPKGTERRVPIDRELWAEITKMVGDREFVLPGDNRNQRYELVTDEFSDWMRGLGWGKSEPGVKAGHELRRLYGSRVYSKLGPAAAKEYLGHASVDTTCKYYARFDQPMVTLETR